MTILASIGILFLVLLSIGLAESKQSGWVLAFLIGIGAIVNFAFPVFFASALAFVIANPLYIVAGFIGYFVIGGIYTTTWRYGAWLADSSDNIRQSFADWKHLTQSSWGNNSYTTDEIKSMYLSSSYYRQAFGPEGNKAKMAQWIIFWPLSLVYHLSYRPVVFAKDVVYKIFANALNRISYKQGAKSLKD